MKDAEKIMSFKFQLPTVWQHGIGITSEIGSIMEGHGCERPLIVTDSLLISLGVVEPVLHLKMKV